MTLRIHHDHLGVPRVLGRVVTSLTPRLRAPWHQSGNPTIPLAQIPDFDWTPANLPILDQGQVGSCVGHGCTQALMVARNEGGQIYIPLSPDGLYSHIDRNVDQGAAPTDGVNWMIDKGVETLADVPDAFIQASRISAAAGQTALRFRVEQADVYQLTTFDELATAMYLRYACIITVNVGGSFTPDPTTGLVNFTPGVADHCVFGGTKKVGDLLWPWNSWTPSWGVGGRFAISAEFIDQQPQSDCWALRTAMVDPLDPNNPPS